MVFPWFSHGFPKVFPWNILRLPRFRLRPPRRSGDLRRPHGAGLGATLGARKLRALRSVRKSGHRWWDGGETWKYSAMIIIIITIFVIIIVIYCYYYFFFLLIKAKLSGWGSVLMAQKWWILGYWCCLQHATWIRLPSFSLATRLILLDQGDPVDTFFVDLLPLQAAKSTECSHHLRVEYQPDACSRDVRIWLLLIVFVIINTTTITLLEFPHLLFHLKTWVCLVSAGFSSFSICSGHKLWVSWYAPFSDTRWPVAAGWSMAQWKQLAQLEFLASRPW